MKFKDLRMGMVVSSKMSNFNNDYTDIDVGVVVDIAYEYAISTTARGTSLNSLRVLPVVKFLSDPSTPRKIAIENIEIYQGESKWQWY